MNGHPDLILHSARVTTLDRGAGEAEALAARDGRPVAARGTRDVMALAGPATRVIDAGGYGCWAA